MPEKAKVPAIRFKGFTDAWEQRKLSDIADIVGGGTPSTSNPEYWDGDIDWYAPAEMEGQRYAVGSVKKITELGLQKSSAQVLPAGRTVLFTSRAGIGKMAILQCSAATNQGFQSIVLKDGTNPYFIYSMGSELKKKAEGIASGSTFLEISGKVLGNLVIAMPSKQEQDKIACYFEKIDDLITLHQRKLLKLKNVKKAMLEKMFPQNNSNVPEIRFAGFTAAWEQRKLGELMMIIGGNAWKSEDYSDTGNYLVVTIANVNGRYFIDDSFGNRIDVDNPGVYLLRKNDILISLTGNVGRVSKMTEIPAVLNQRVAKVVVDRANIDNEFIYQILSSFRFENAMIKAGQGAAQSNISNSNVKEYSAFMPNSRSEQAEIGAVFKHLDNLITLHQRKVEKFQNLKKACLEKMFV